jgi:hypothetical protein
MVNVRPGVLMTAALSLAAMAGCGGAAFVLGTDAGGADTGVGGTGKDGSASDGDASDAGAGDAEGGGGPLCPPTAPERASACSRDGLSCEYGTSASVDCDIVVTCMPEGWVQADAVVCTMGQCPATYDAVPMGQACNPSGLACGYAKGTCSCSSLPGPVEVIDGAVVVDWHCLPATTGCPSPRPRLGTTCPTEGTSCNYGACSGGVQLSCDGGVWQTAAVACPI